MGSLTAVLLLSLFVALSSSFEVNNQANETNQPTRYLPRKREQFQVIYEWRAINYTWPSEQAYQDAIRDGKYIPRNVHISGIKHYNGTLYVSMPRSRPGIPVTMGTIPVEPVNGDTEPKFTPFPNWDLNVVGDCRAFQSVQSFEIDLEGRAWIIDSGRTGPANESNPMPTCPPSLTIYDIKNNKFNMRFIFPESVANGSSYLNDIVIDDSEGGYAYITDNSALDPGIIVFSKEENKSWKFREPHSMRASKNAIFFSVNGTNWNMSVNIDGIALGPRYVNKKNVVDRNVYYCPLSSYKLHGVPSIVLKNESFSKGFAQTRIKLVAELGNKSSQTDGMIMDEEGFLYYGLIGNYSIAHWDHKTNFETNQDVISKDRRFIQWPDRFAFDDVGNLYVTVNKLHKYLADDIDVNEVNYRILRSHVGARSYMYSPMLMPYQNNQTKPGIVSIKPRTSGATTVLSSWLGLLATTMLVIRHI